MTSRALGIDVGDRRIGVAVSDPQGTMAIPVGVIHRVGGSPDWEALLEHARSREVESLVVGMPLSLNGRRGPQALKVLAFVEALKKLTDLPVVTWDERLTSVEADRRLREVPGRGRGGRGPARPGKVTQDALAAAIMLQAYLDAQRWR